MEVLRFAMLGLGLGALYSLASQGLLVVYRGSGVLNFAHGAIGMVGAYVAWEMEVTRGQNVALAWAIGIAVSTLLGALTHLLIMRQLRRASPLARIVATLGVLILLQGAAVLRYGSTITFVESTLPTTVVRPFGQAISIDRFILVGIAAVISVLLWVFYRYSKFGMATSAVAENERAASSLALSPDRIATANWALGSALAAVAAILIAPIVQLQVLTMTNLVLAAMAAALVAGFRSFPVAFVAGVAIGIGETILGRYGPEAGGWLTPTGLSKSLPFIVIIVWMLIRGQALPLRDYFLQRLPAVGSGRIRPIPIAVAAAITVFLIATLSTRWQAAFGTTLSMGVVLLSIVVITGYAGQLSLGQFALAGIGALVAGQLMDNAGWGFLPALVVGALAAVPVGALFALPAVRARGINLAIVTLGLGSAVELLVFNNGKFVGGFEGLDIGEPSIFGWDINAPGRPDRYAYVALVLFILMALMVANVRRGRTGRRLLAVRTNERAAAALGISVPGAKVYAFALSAGIAAVGGILLAFENQYIKYGTEFPSFTSILAVGWAFIGGIGYLVGPLFGATLAPGSIGAQITNRIFEDLERYLQLIGGGILVLLVLQNQDGIAREAVSQMKAIGGKVRSLLRRPERPAPTVELPEPRRERVQPKSLEVQHLTVRYGGVMAVDDVSFTVEPGTIVGLIGPNGAGKTSVIDAVTGFTRPSGGTVLLEGAAVDDLTAARRARAGISRSFQSLELFEDATVLDNLRAASDPRDKVSYLRDLVYPKAPPLPGEVVMAVEEFDLRDVLLRHVQDLPYGQRRLLAIARAVATEPNVLLLDEPAAGLGEVESGELAHLVRRLADEWGIGVLLVEHDMNFVMSVCDRIVVLDFGRVISEGTPEEVRQDPLVIGAYLGDADTEFEAPPPSDGDGATAGHGDGSSGTDSTTSGEVAR